ncbi:MAG: redoxin domain-containing protein [Nanoarchaeota archaeon]
MIKINSRVSDLEIDAFHNNSIKKIRLSDYRGKWLAMIFYPKDFTFICPTELEEAAELYPYFQKEKCEVLAISTDTVEVHKAWHDTSPAVAKVSYPMLADPTGRLCKEFGTYIEEEGISLRGSFVIDPDGILKTMEIHNNDVGRSALELLRKVQAAKFVRENPGQVCPAKWAPGQSAIKPSLDLVGKI